MDFLDIYKVLQVLPKLYKANKHRLLKTRCDFKIFHICFVYDLYNNTTA